MELKEAAVTAYARLLLWLIGPALDLRDRKSNRITHRFVVEDSSGHERLLSQIQAPRSKFPGK